MPGSGSEMGASSVCQKRSGSVSHTYRSSLTCANAREQRMRNPAYLVRDEEAAGSNPATPTSSRA